MPTERRALDHQLVAQVGKPEVELIAWWKARFEQIAALPMATARAGALVPGWRELQMLPRPQRIAVTRARMLAAMQLTPEQEERVFEARAIGARQVPDVARDDLEFITQQVLPTLPPEAQERARARLAAGQR